MRVQVDISLIGQSMPPNGSRLSCGRNARRHKETEPQTKRLASEATQFLPTCERPAASSAGEAAARIGPMGVAPRMQQQYSPNCIKDVHRHFECWPRDPCP